MRCVLLHVILYRVCGSIESLDVCKISNFMSIPTLADIHKFSMPQHLAAISSGRRGTQLFARRNIISSISLFYAQIV